MPKKTRQAKIMAQLRRLQEQAKVPSETKEERISGSLTNIAPKTLEKTSATSTKIVSSSGTGDYLYVVKDLRKTLIFASGAIIFELILSLAKNYWH